ncbi:MAG: hypothetical protein ACD_49C00036G0002 [uncultured bacterium (gcode 4)]|uniref:Uncharacterized protein n=1 Tax=uncultured bacterium (gcode 4) TaxID=1234023 RepID=K2BWA1_9BACT|nr:MAG: hypothetical protein ACD_49C00036G0002 [uncultured bacterium (gcode 4)]
MTTLTIENSIKLQKTNFISMDDLLDYLLSLKISNMKYEDVSKEEKESLDNLKWMSTFKNIVKNLKV